MTSFEGCDDRVLIEQTLAGQADCFAVLMKRHVNSVRRQIDSILHNSEDKDDVVQQVMLNAWRHLSDFRGESSFRTWISRVAINEGLMTFRRLRARTIYQAELDTLMSRAESPHQSAARREAELRVRRAIASLPKRYREVLVLRDIQELDTKETAAHLGLTVASVKTRLFRGRALLSAVLRPKTQSNRLLQNTGKEWQ